MNTNSSIAPDEFFRQIDELLLGEVERQFGSSAYIMVGGGPAQGLFKLFRYGLQRTVIGIGADLPLVKKIQKAVRQAGKECGAFEAIEACYEAVESAIRTWTDDRRVRVELIGTDIRLVAWMAPAEPVKGKQRRLLMELEGECPIEGRFNSSNCGQELARGVAP